MSPFLLDEELSVMTYPMRQAAAQRRFLDRVGIPYISRPDGRPLVSREALAGRLAGGAQTAAEAASNDEPNVAALRARTGKGKRHGKAA